MSADMSTRAIAPIVGASHMTVKRDLEPGVTNVTPESPPSAPTPEPPRWTDEHGDEWPITGAWCDGCGLPLTRVTADQTTHPTCAPEDDR